MRTLFLAPLLVLSLSPWLMAKDIPVSSSVELDQALRASTTQGGDVIRLAPTPDASPYTLTQHVGSLRYGTGDPLTITSTNPNTPAVIDCSSNCYLSGVQGLRFENVTVIGRMNWDSATHPQQSGNLSFLRCTFMDANGWNEMLKLTHLHNVTIQESKFIRRGTGSYDRPVDAVGVINLTVERSYFERCHFGCIQSKGGAENTIVRYNLFNGGGERAVQFGGSTCPTCWAKLADGSQPPAPKGFESMGGEMSHNVIIGGGACWSLSTQDGAYIHHNTCYIPPNHSVPNANGTFGGGQYFFRLLQEVDPAMPPGIVQQNRNGRIEKNLFLYVLKTDDGRAGINSQFVNFAANGLVDWPSFQFDANAVYAASPILDNPNWAARNPPVYPHNHPVTDFGPWMPFNWKQGLINQVYPQVVDWGLGSMRAFAQKYSDIGALVDRLNPAGIPGMTIPNPAPAPKSPTEYPTGTDFFSWVWPGYDGPYPGLIEVHPPPVLEPITYLVTIPSGYTLEFPTYEEAKAWVGAIRIRKFRPVE